MAGDNSITYIDNPVAFYIYNKVDCMRETDLISICKNFYDEDEISCAKDIVYKTYELENEKIIRKGQNKIVSDLQDIIKLIRNKPALLTTKFCVTGCTRLPAVSLEHIDVSTLLSQVSELRMQINKFQNIQQQVDDLSSSVSELRNSNSRVRSPCQKTHQVISTTPSVKEIIDKIEVNNGCPNDRDKLIRDNNLEIVKKSEPKLDLAKESLYPDLSGFSNLSSQALNCSATNDDLEGNFITGEFDSDLEINTGKNQLEGARPSRTIYNRNHSDRPGYSNRTPRRKDSLLSSYPHTCKLF